MAKDIPQNPKRNAKGIRQSPKKNAKGISKNSKKNAKGIPQNPKGNDEKYRQEFITRLRKSGATQKEMADARGWTEGMISKMLHGKIPPQLDDFLQAFAPFFVCAGGITAPATVVKMAAYLGGTVEDGDMAEVIRAAERYCKVPIERTRVEEFRKRVVSAQKVRTPTPASASAVATTEAQPRAANGALARQCLTELVQHILGQCSLQPAVCGYQFPLSAAIERTLTVEPTTGEASAPISLDALRHPRQTLGLLAGVPGSGHTVFLLQLAYAWASSWSNSQPTPIAIYVDAPAFLEYAGHRRDIFHFWAAQVTPLQKG